jgi:hypothetical protein
VTDVVLFKPGSYQFTQKYLQAPNFLAYLPVYIVQGHSLHSGFGGKLTMKGRLEVAMLF